MYRDDLEALRARLTTVEAELAAEKQHRAAAVAKMQAALAAADEERVKAKLAGEDTKLTRLPGYWRNWRTLVLLGVIAGLVAAFGVLLVLDDGAQEEVVVLQSSAMTKHLEQSRKEIAQLKKLSEVQGLELRSLAARCRRPAPPPEPPNPDWVMRPFDDGSPLPEAVQLLSSAQNAYVAGNHKRALQLARQVLRLVPAHTKAIQILGASACYLRHRADAQWAYERVKVSYRPLLKKICLRNSVELREP